MPESLPVMDPPEINTPEGIVDTSIMGVESHSNDTRAAVYSNGESTEAGPNTVLSTDARLKPKKKKGLLMTTASGGGSVGNHGENTGRWTAEEHRLFLQGLEQHGKGWKKIASLIKSRTVVQIRTHAQKYFQKLAKARQNGEDEGAVTFMEGRGGAASTTSASTVIPRRRRQVTGTKRKAIQSVVASAQRQVKKVAATTGVPDPMAVPIAPALKFFVLPTEADASANSTELGNVSGPALEDSLFRFLTPCPPVDGSVPQVNNIARQVGANPITLPSGDVKPAAIADGEVSPTSVFDLSIYPAWADAKEAPSWFTKGEDVDALLDVAESLDWLADTGDFNDAYEAPQMEESTDNSLSVMDDEADDIAEHPGSSFVISNAVANSLELPRVDSSIDTMVPTLPSFYSQNDTSYTNLLSHAGEGQISTGDFKSLPSGLLDSQLQVFDTPMEEHAFVSTILEDDIHHHENSDCLPSLA